MRKRAFFFDIDGTLYQNRFHEVSRKTVWALRRLLEQDQPVYLVSSRSIHEMKHLPEEFYSLLFDGMVLEGGALVLDQRRNCISKKTIEPQQVRKVIDFCDRNDLVWRYSTLDGNYFGTRPTSEIHRGMFRLYMEAPEYKPYEDEEVFNILVWSRDPQIHEEARKLFSGFSMVEYEGCLELRHPQASKEAEVERICRENRFEQTVAFGDGANDAGMLRFADLGIAMGNAYPPAREAADQICLPVEEDGVADYLETRHWV